MREFKVTILAAVALAFVAGIGAGSWFGNLRASPSQSMPSVDRRLRTWTKRYDLTPSQQRRMRSVLVRYDGRRENIYSDLSREQLRRLDELRTRTQPEIDEILGERTTDDSPGGG